ncbi:MAG: SCO family protein [Oceanospirillaceae bacterium]
MTLNKGIHKSNNNSSTSQNTMGDKLGGDFSLPIADGEFRLADYRGKVVVLYFGYASCPDVCPTALALLGNTLKIMPKDVTDQIQPLFISVDPARDKLPTLKQYGQYFHPSLLAGTTEQAKIDTLVRQYGAFYSFTTLENSAMGYSVDHSSRLYLINKNGKLADTVSHADIQQDLAQKLLKLTN